MRADLSVSLFSLSVYLSAPNALLCRRDTCSEHVRTTETSARLHGCMHAHAPPSAETIMHDAGLHVYVGIARLCWVECYFLFFFS